MDNPALYAIEVALESAQSCIMGETPEVMSDDAAREWTLDAIKGALLVHLPAIRAELEAAHRITDEMAEAIMGLSA